MSIKIVADSSADLLVLDGVEFSSVPLKVIVGEHEFADDETVDMRRLGALLQGHQGKTSTSCPSVDDWLRAFGDAEDIFCVTIASTMSGSYSTACVAKREYEREYPARHVYVIDSLSIGPEMTLLIEYLRDLAVSGMEAVHIHQAVLKYKSRTHLLFSLERLQNCANSGRIRQCVAKGIGVLGIRVVGRAGERGDLQVLEKCRGAKQSRSSMIQYMKNLGYSGGRVVITHNENESGAIDLMRQMREVFGAIDVRIRNTRALCSYYAEPGALLVGMEC